MSKTKEKSFEFTLELLQDYCKGCGLCVSVCRVGKLDIDTAPNARGVQPVMAHGHIVCSGCLRCTAICPEAAIEIYRLETDRGVPTHERQP